MKRQDKINTSQRVAEAAQNMGCFRSEAKELIQDYFLESILRHLGDGRAVGLSRIGVLYPARAKTPRAAGQYRMTIRFEPSASAKKILTGEKEEKRLRNEIVPEDAKKHRNPTAPSPGGRITAGT